MIQEIRVMKLESYNKETKTITTNFNEKKAACNTQNFYNLLVFLLITIALLFQDTNNKLRKVLYG